jgi:serine-type D-Ala-D-Ala carboxypeptidase (penicillin-binding protein 5/6)
MRIINKYFVVIVFIVNIFNINAIVFASEYVEIKSGAAMVIEKTTGKVIYAKNENERMYPASTTKILTAIVALEYLNKDDLLLVGTEIYSIPNDSSKAGNVVGEYILVENAIRGLLMKSGNETACVLAKATVEKIHGRKFDNFKEAEILFANLMNEKAKQLGAVNSNFVNAHGYHNDNHFTTASDLILIAKEAMKNELIMLVSTETNFIGNGAGSNKEGLMSKNYNWTTHNLLLDEKSDYYYPYATGIKTGYTNEAKKCLVSSATKNDVELIAVILSSDLEEHFKDTVKLYDYGFTLYKFDTLVTKDIPVNKIELNKPRLGESSTLNLIAEETYTGFFSKDELLGKEILITYNKEIIDVSENNQNTFELKTDIKKDMVLATIKISYEGNEIYEGNLLAENDVLIRTFVTDIGYNLESFKTNIMKTLLFLLMGIIISVVMLILLIRIRRIIRRNKNTKKYRLNNRR